MCIDLQKPNMQVGPSAAAGASTDSTIKKVQFNTYAEEKGPLYHLAPSLTWCPHLSDGHLIGIGVELHSTTEAAARWVHGECRCITHRAAVATPNKGPHQITGTLLQYGHLKHVGRYGKGHSSHTQCNSGKGTPHAGLVWSSSCGYQCKHTPGCAYWSFEAQQS
jgi:hypothetical protein